jgi:three-Cys-motif partner protein
MAKRQDTVWERKRHTQAKHEVLVGYLDAWIPIIGSWAEHALLIDGFAGPGKYEGGEKGSPLLMLDAFLRRKDRDQLKPIFHFVFIEANRERYEHLKGVIEKRKLHPKVDVRVLHGEFSEHFPAVLEHFRGELGELPPTFAFVDPFGADDTAHRLTSSLIKLPRCEALVYVPISHLARFVDHPDMTATLDNLYGGRSWEPATKLATIAERRQVLQDAFRNRMRESCRWVRWFEITPEKGGNAYCLFFGTNDKRGLQRMKDAMWKIDPVEGTRFKDSTTVDHPVLFEQAPDLDRLELLLRIRFGGEEFSIEQAACFTLTETAFRDNGHLKPMLKVAEEDGRLEVTKAKENRRRGQFPAGTCMRFV